LAGEPELEKAEFDENGGFTVIALLETWPEVVLSEYKGLPITRDKLIVLESAVENRLEGLRLQHAAEIEITDRNICEKGDYVRIDFEGKKKDGEPFPGGSSKNYCSNGHSEVHYQGSRMASSA
jgi:FKBP-type peptidyl-prolyl cis-trans isomerase (trigger factor)